LPRFHHAQRGVDTLHSSFLIRRLCLPHLTTRCRGVQARAIPCAAMATMTGTPGWTKPLQLQSAPECRFAGRHSTAPIVCALIPIRLIQHWTTPPTLAMPRCCLLTSARRNLPYGSNSRGAWSVSRHQNLSRSPGEAGADAWWEMA